MCELLVEGLGRPDWAVRSVTNADAALAELAAAEHDLVITDLRMPGMNGIELCRQIVARVGQEIPVMVLTAFGDYDMAVDAMRAGAYDFLAKPVKLDVLDLAVARALDHRLLRREVNRLAARVSTGGEFDELFGASDAM